MATPMDLELYGIFFLLVLFALLGCGLAYTCICCYSFFRKRILQNGLHRSTQRSESAPGCPHRNTQSQHNPRREGAISALQRSDPPLHFASNPSWTSQASWPIQPLTRTMSSQNSNSGSIVSAGRISFNMIPHSPSESVATTRNLLHANEHPFNLYPGECYFPNTLNSSDLPPTYEEAIKDKTVADVPSVNAV